MAALEKWVTAGTAEPFYVRKKFRIGKEIEKGVAKVCGLGQFIFYINGKKVGDHELDPGWTNYRKLIQYVTFDVTDYLRPGENALGAEVGNGWFIKTDKYYTFKFPEFMPPNPNDYKPFGKYLVFALELEILYKDGSMDIIRADETFRKKAHPVVMSNVYGSEIIDGRLRQKGWSGAEFDDSCWEQVLAVPENETPEGKLEEQFQPPVKVIHTYEGRFLHKAGSREIYDFGQNMSGILEAEACGQKGDMLKFYPAEKLTADGDADQYAKGWVNVDSCITFILGEDGEWENFRMKFTYFAGRYMAVEKVYTETEPLLRSIKAHAVSSAWKTDGTFTCDDRRYEQIYDLVEKAVEANMVSVYTDCPAIERFAWREPNHLMAPSIMYMKDGRKLWEKFLLDMRTDQHTAEDCFYDFDGNKIRPGAGLMPSQCPCYMPNVMPVPGMGSFYDIIAWGSTCILGVWWHYQFYGDIRIIQENYEAGMRYLDHLKTKMTAEGFISHGLGDWGNPEGELLRENIETVFLYADTIILKKFAGILGRADDADKLEVFAARVRQNYNEKLLIWDTEKNMWCYRAWDHPKKIFITQASQALPLYWGMVPEEKTEDVVKAFRMSLVEKQAFIAGEVGLPYVIQAARRYGMNDLTAQFILNETHPSYYAFVMDGETTLGEYWEKNPRSHCHDMMGHITEWYYNGIAGIIPEEPGFKKVKISPYLPPSVKEFSCSYSSVSGRISVHVKELQEEVVLEIEIPENMGYEVETDSLKQRGKPVNSRIEFRR